MLVVFINESIRRLFCLSFSTTTEISVYFVCTIEYPKINNKSHYQPRKDDGDVFLRVVQFIYSGYNLIPFLFIVVIQGFIGHTIGNQ